MTYDELEKRAASVGITKVTRPHLHLQRDAFEFKGLVVGPVHPADFRDFLEGVSAALDAVEAMQQKEVPQ